MLHSSVMKGSDLLKMDLTSEAENVWQPTPHGRFLAKVLSENNFVENLSVLELGSGVGNHTILLLRQGVKHLVATEITKEFQETTRRNVSKNLPEATNIEYRVADWLDTAGQFDAVVTNPPFCKSGKQNRRYYIDSLILDAHKRLLPNGLLIFVQSSMADIAKTLRRLEENGFSAEVVDQEENLFRDYYFEDEAFMEEIQTVPNGFEVRDGSHYETLYVVKARLQSWSPPEGAHI